MNHCSIFKHLVSLTLTIIAAILFFGGCGSSELPINKIKKALKDTSTYSIILEDMKEEGNFFRRYSHKYRIAKDDDGWTTNWLEVPEEYYLTNERFLGMSLTAKKEDKEISCVTPPGYAYVGDSGYGHWRDDYRGGSLWEFDGKYRIFIDSLGGWYRPIYRDDYQIYSRYRAENITYYGHGNEYGTTGSVVKQQKPGFYALRMAKERAKRASLRDRISSRIERNRTGFHGRTVAGGKALMTLDDFLAAIILVALFYVLFLIGKVVNNILHYGYKLNHELIEKDNSAVAIAVSGYYMGLVLSIGGSLAGPSSGISEDIIDLGIYGLLSIVLLNISCFLYDKLILYKFKISDGLIRDQNQGTGMVSCAVSIASGFIVYGAVAGEGGTIWTAIAFWALGHLILIIAGLLYNFMIPYDLHSEIEKDNVAASISFAGALIAMGIVVGMAAEGYFYSWPENLLSYMWIVFLGLIVLSFIRILKDKVLLPLVKFANEAANQQKPKLGAAYIEAFTYISAALVIYLCV